jgi:hypothetical protein
MANESGMYALAAGVFGYEPTTALTNFGVSITRPLMARPHSPTAMHQPEASPG